VSALLCRSCSGADVEVFLSLGDLPLVDRLVAPGEDPADAARYPLDIAFCADCTLVQVAQVVDADIVFAEDYPYYSSFSEDLLAHSRQHTDQLVQQRGLGPTSFVVEVACNDGYLLKGLKDRGVPALGIDPAPGPVGAARALGLDVVLGFFGRDTARAVVAARGHADVVVANNVMAHVPDLNGFVAGLSELVADDGVVTVENPWVLELLARRAFDTIYHEHVCYFSCTAVQHLAARHGLVLVHVEHFPDLHGGTLRWHLAKTGEPSAEVAHALSRELASGVTQRGAYTGFEAAVRELCAELRELLQGLRAGGARLAAYGAAAKGATLLNVSGLGTDLLDFVVDRNPVKQGMRMPGSGLPILPVEALLEQQPDYVLVLAWNIADEVVRQQQAYLDAGGQFVLPVPVPVVLARSGAVSA